MTVTLTANAGVMLELGGRRIWVDALHDRKTPPFSTVSGEIWEKMQEFPAPDYILFTHCHPDHYSEKLTEAAKNHWKSAKVMAPEGKFAAFSGKGFLFADGDLNVEFFSLPHEGAQYQNVRHFGIFLEIPGKKVLIPGDCALAAGQLQGREADVMILDFPWVTTSKGRGFLEKHYPNAVKVLVHLPFAADDRFGYRKAAARWAETDKNIRILQDPLQSLTL